ncbi:MAG TPA: hypothetical protein VFB21_03055 [Chthonomonadaceae bacterium]|nr:hypothetical protein [Chthonomonadaceae bacterium]
MFRNTATALLFCTVCIVALSHPALAQVYSITITGRIGQFYQDASEDDSQAFDSTIHIGTRYTATFAVDQNTPFIPGAFWGAGYLDSSPAAEARVTFGDYITTLDTGHPWHQTALYIAHSWIDALTLAGYYGAGSGLSNVQVKATLESPGSQAFTSVDHLPLTGPGLTDINRWTYRNFEFAAFVPSYGLARFEGSIDSITDSAVSEPDTLALVGSFGLFGLAFISRRLYHRC